MSSMAVGSAFEKLTIEVLRPLGFHLAHSGRPGDKGVDFVGHWVLPDKRVPIAGQCKCRGSRRIDRRYILEMESILCRYNQEHKYRKSNLSEQRGSEFVGVVASYSGFTESGFVHLYSSEVPLILVQVVIGHINKNESKSEDGQAEQLYEALQQYREWQKLRLASMSLVDTTGNPSGAARPKVLKSKRIAGGSRVIAESAAEERPKMKGFLTGFVMNKKALSLVGNASLCWQHEISYGDKKLLAEPVLFYNHQEVTTEL